ncbi:MAG: hypothetical protein KZQ83_00540 [gamma proteobacterium symbiont of Taylorina sp.]|nr:hypothetical protein [gamma proteobacterium symbiont of Taylorina sp.]
MADTIQNTEINHPPPNLIVFSGGKRQSEADRLLIEFVDTCLIMDDYERKLIFRDLRPVIFAYVQGLKDKGVPA